MNETKEGAIRQSTENPIEKIDLVYIVNTKIGTLPKNLELRYSIRSAVKHFANLGKIHIVGKHLPRWAKGISHLKTEEILDGQSRMAMKAECMSRKIETACRSKKVSSRFLRMCDDYVFMQDTDIDWFEKNPLARIDPKTKKGKEEAEFYYGKDYLKLGYSVLHHKFLTKVEEEFDRGIDFEIHSPMLFEKEKALETLKLFGRIMTLCTAYGNHHYENPILDGMYGYKHRAQIRSRQSKRGVIDHMKGKRFLNWDEQALRHSSLMKYLKASFGEACRFEK